MERQLLFKDILNKLMITFAVLNFSGWIAFFFNGYLFAHALSCCSGTIKIEDFFYIMIISIIIPMIITRFNKKKTRVIFTLIGASSWIIFMVTWVVFLSGSGVDLLNTRKIIAGQFILANPLLIFMTGIAIIFASTSTMVRKLEETGLDKSSLATDIIIASVAVILIGFFNEFLFSSNLLLLLSIISAILQVYHAFTTINDERHLVGYKNVFFAIFTFIFAVLIFAFSGLIGITSIFFTHFDLGFILISTGILLATIICEIINRMTKNRIPWPFYLVVGFIIAILESFLLLGGLDFSDSTYHTNPPALHATLISGIVMGIIIYSLILAYHQFSKMDNAKTRRAHEMGRFVMIYGIILALIFAFYQGLGEVTFKTSFKEVLSYGIGVILVAAAIIFTFTVIGVKARILHFSTSRMNDEQGEGKRRKTNVSIKTGKYNKPVIITSIVIASLMVVTLFPNMIPLKVSSSGYPNYLGAIGTNFIAEVSPLSKVSEHFLLPAPPSSANLNNPVIHRSMAKNEFETIQIVISNLEWTPTTIRNVSISNFTSDGLDGAFCRPDVMKTWKGETWHWKRFEVKYVKEIQPGYPNILYDLEGDQALAQVYAGQSGEKPKPIANPGMSLSLWITLYSSSDLAPGNYSDRITIETNKWTSSIKLETRIWNFTIPEHHGFRTAIGNRAVYFLETRDYFTKNFLKHRISPYFPYNLRNLYKVNWTNHSVEFNFTGFELDLANAIENGLDSFRITFSPGGIKNNDNAFSQEFNETTLSFYSQLGNFLGNRTTPDNKTWLDLALVYAIDEPDEKDYDNFRKWSNLIHSAHPGWKILLTEQVEKKINGTVDIWCPYINNLNKENILPQKALGNEFWYYTCCNLVNEPTVSFVDPAIDHLAIFWSGWAMNFDGYLFWDAQAYINSSLSQISNVDPFRVGYDGIGDAIMLLADMNYKPVDTIVWDTMRDGLENVESMMLLNNLNPNSSILKEIRSSWISFNEYPRDYNHYLELREKIGNALDILS
ncbi:MAG: glycoside hydrolase domain-containing protein [Promethearchaeota archaeon]